MGIASSMAHSCAPSSQGGRLPLLGLETAMGQVVLCSLVCASVPFAGRAPIPRLVAGADDQSKTERDAQSSRQHRRLYWLFGFLFESVGDAELARFVKDPLNKGKLLRSGLWRYTRHPNYFGEVALWWGIWLIALGVPGGWFGIVGPLTITILILKVSGIPMLERRWPSIPISLSTQEAPACSFPGFQKDNSVHSITRKR